LESRSSTPLIRVMRWAGSKDFETPRLRRKIGAV
jgi:hypothetical protein